MVKEGQESKANHFALHVFGKVLPEDAKIDLQSRIEQTEKKEMDEHLSRLKGINSALAVKQIEKWLKDKRTPEYKKEAGLMYMLEKYGALCCKHALYKYK